MKKKTNKLTEHKKVKSEHEKEKDSETVIDHSTRMALDAILCFIILLAASFSMIYITSPPDDSESYFSDYSNSDEYTYTSMYSILGSTVPRVTYYDPEGEKIDVVGQTIERLIRYDLALRSEGSVQNNLTSLEQDFEKKIEIQITSAFGSHIDFILTAEYTSLPSNDRNTDVELFITNLDDGTELDQDIKPSFQISLIPLQFQINDDKSNPADDELTDEVVIKLYFI